MVSIRMLPLPSLETSLMRMDCCFYYRMKPSFHRQLVQRHKLDMQHKILSSQTPLRAASSSMMTRQAHEIFWPGRLHATRTPMSVRLAVLGFNKLFDYLTVAKRAHQNNRENRPRKEYRSQPVTTCGRNLGLQQRFKKIMQIIESQLQSILVCLTAAFPSNAIKS